MKAVAAQRVNGVLHRLARFGSDGNKACGCEVGDASLLEGFGGGGLERDGRGNRIDVERAGENAEEQCDVCHGASHGADGAEESERAGVVREMTCGGNAARGGLHGADAGEMCGLAYGAAAVRTKPSRGEARGDGRRFTAAGTAGGAR